MVFAITIALTSFFQLQNIHSSILNSNEQIKDISARESSKALEQLVKESIKEKSHDVANQVEIYIQSHPKMTAKDLQNDKFFENIAIQSVGESGYTVVHDSKGISFFHVNPEVVNKDISFLQYDYPDFWKIFERSLIGESEGFYLWEDSDGVERNKYMYVTPIKTPTADGITFRVAATSYIDEFLAPSTEIRNELIHLSDNSIAKTKMLLSLSNNQFIITIMIIIGMVLVIIGFIYIYYIKPVHELSYIANKISSGNRKLRAKVHSSDEIGKLANSFNEMTKELIKINKELESKVDIETSKMKSFVSIASHQLRTPLTGVKWFLELMTKKKNKNLTKEQKEYLDHIYTTNERMIALVNKILNVSKIDVSNLRAERSETNINEIIDSIMKDNIAAIEKKKIQIINNTPKNLFLFVDTEKIEQVLHNLISNAIKYTKNKVKIDIKKKKNEVQFRISDNGIGIPKEQEEQLFQKFFRADNVKRANIEGTGLGLYIAKINVEAHGGKIWYTPTTNGGCEFIFTLKDVKKKK